MTARGGCVSSGRKGISSTARVGEQEGEGSEEDAPCKPQGRLHLLLLPRRSSSAQGQARLLRAKRKGLKSTRAYDYDSWSRSLPHLSEKTKRRVSTRHE